MALDNDQLKDVTLRGVVRANKDLGRGSFCKVFAVKYCGLLCAAKEIHSILTEGVNEEEKQAIKSSFVRECHQCSVIRHPNIVQFIGVWYSTERSDLPIMVMELMDQSLTSYIESDANKIAIETKISILHDVSLGLSYLHARDPPVVHRDLSSNNVLLTDHFKAKISDLGLAKIIKADSKRMTSRLTTAPGTLTFMPPETMDESDPVYGTPVDVFSFAVIAVHIFSEEWPAPAPAVKKDTKTKSLIALSEKERRQRYLDKMIVDTMLKKLVEDCLDNDPIDRPAIEVVCEKIEQLKEAETTDGRPSKKINVSAPVAPHAKKEDFSVYPSDHKMQQTKNLEMQQAKDQQAKEHKMQQAKAAKAALDQPNKSGVSPPVVPDVKKQDFYVTPLHHQDTQQTMEPPPVVDALQAQGHSITWMTCANLPYSFYDASVAVDGEAVYVTAGGAPSSITKNVIYCYNIGTDKWNTLPKPGHDCGILQMVGGKLVIFGGEDPVNYTVLNKVSTYNKDSQIWDSHFPNMLNRRFLPGVTVHQEYVIVMGGLSSLDKYYDSIEMLNWQQPSSWIEISIHLPHPMGAIKPTISGKYLIIIGYEQKGFRYNTTYQILFDTLRLSYNQRIPQGDHWKHLPNAPYYFTATVPYSNPPLIIGGDAKNVPTADICFLDISKSSWVKVDSLNIARKQVGVAAINSTTIIVIGGSVKGGSSEANKQSSLPTVEIGYILPNN